MYLGSGYAGNCHELDLNLLLLLKNILLHISFKMKMLARGKYYGA